MSISLRVLAGTLALGALTAGQASATTYLSATFNDFTNGNSIMTQAGTGLMVEANGDLPGWTKSSTTGNIHAVQRSTGDFAIMLYDGAAMYYATPLNANTKGVTYTVSFDGATGVYADARQATGSGDYVEFRVNDATGTIGMFDYTPTSSAFSPVTFTYVGSGAPGGVYLNILNGGNGDGRFGGSIDNLVVSDAALNAVSPVPEPMSLALLGTGLVAAGVVRRRAR